MISGKILTFIVVSVAQVTLAQDEGPTVTIPDGKILGAVNFTARENLTFYTFRGIPYAKPPVGDLRFSAPVRNDPWNGTYNGTFERDICTQMTDTLALLDSTVLGSEDCLYVNVYTTNISASLPVMLWIHGGTFQTGSNSMGRFPPDHFLEKGVILVSLNYRLGLFGFFCTGDASASGNWGLKDQLLALKWVKSNIKYFGGDPDRITIFGQSAGATSVSYLVQSSQTRGLFSSAIMQSGSSLCQWGLTRNTPEHSTKVGKHLFNITLHSQELVNKLRGVDHKALKLAENQITLDSYFSENLLGGGLPWGPVQEPDAEGALFTNSSRSWEKYSNGSFQRVPMIMGFDSNEAAAMTSYLSVARVFLSKYNSNVSRFAPIDLTSNTSLRVVIGTIVRNHYLGTGSEESQLENLPQFINIDQFLRPIREHIILASKYVNMYYYEFSYKGLLGSPDNDTVGVGHGDELNYFFKLNNSISSQDKTARDRLVTLWTNFAKTGNPTPHPTSDTVLGTTIWTANNATTDASKNIFYLNINSSLTMSNNPFQTEWTFYQDLYNKYGDGEYTTY